MSARCRGLNQVPGNDRRQALALLLGGSLAGAALGAPRQAFAGATQMAALPIDEHFMRIAIAEAAKADFPFGAVIVRNGDVLFDWPQLGQNHQRSDGAWRNGGDSPLRRGAARR